MASIDASTIGTAVAIGGLLFLGGSTWLQYRETRKSRHLVEYQINADLEEKLNALYPRLGPALGFPDDSIPEQHRVAIVNFFVIYAEAWKASKLRLYRDRNWDGLRGEFAYWASRPEAVNAMREQRANYADCWPIGFFDFVASEVAAFQLRR